MLTGCYSKGVHVDVITICLNVCAVVVSSRKSASVDATVESFRAKGIECTGRRCHVGSAEDRAALLAHAKKVLRLANWSMCTSCTTSESRVQHSLVDTKCAAAGQIT